MVVLTMDTIGVEYIKTVGNKCRRFGVLVRHNRNLYTIKIRELVPEPVLLEVVLDS